MAKAKLEKEIETWFDDLPEELADAFLEYTEIDDDVISFNIGEEEHSFTVNYPKDYPANKEDQFFLSSDDDALASLISEVNEWAGKGRITVATLMSDIAERFIKANGKAEEDENEDDDMEMFADEPEKAPKAKKSAAELEIEKKLEGGGFLEIGSAQATLRIINDLKNIKKQKPEELGFAADPVVDKSKGLQNLYHWHIKLFGIDKDSPLFNDIQAFKKKTGQDYILLEMRFSKDYPHVPPFVRVVKPRFQFRTGHVTLGGSICMELLTNSGWNATNDIESILMQISSELICGGARLDSGSGNYEYSEHEAWEAFIRAANTHGWNVNGLNQNMFPKV